MPRHLQAFGLSLLLLACSPALNWREVRVEGGGLSVLLPCKPDRATKTVPLGGSPATLAVMGCEAAGAMFVVSVAELGQAERSATVLLQWQDLTLAHMRAVQPVRQPVQVAGAAGAAVRIAARGSHPDGQAVEAQAIFFARGSQIFQAVVYAPRISPDAAETFFASLKLS
ncbi:MAG: hypothetical protein ACKOCZ_07835 [Betaproteobacteria bacterium]|nr:hypothetical protein [Betaproteobacteria bacterium]